jgi:hypothetical protein
MEEKDRIEFAKLLMQYVRDEAIRSSDIQLHAHEHGQSPSAKRYKEAIQSGQSLKLGEMLITDSIDSALFYFFYAIDNGLINLSFTNSEGKTIKLTDDGEWAGWYMGEWRYDLSKERCDNDLDDVRLG